MPDEGRWLQFFIGLRITAKDTPTGWPMNTLRTAAPSRARQAGNDPLAHQLRSPAYSSFGSDARRDRHRLPGPGDRGAGFRPGDDLAREGPAAHARGRPGDAGRAPAPRVHPGPGLRR